jgi:glycosyltransferase involved in cell wall biosynthesis
MRIGMLVEAYKPHISGVTNFIALNKQHFEKLGHEVFVFTFGGKHYQDDEPNILRSPGIPLGKTGFYLGLGYPRSICKLLFTMDVAHVHHPFLSGILAVHYCKPRNIPIVFTNHTRYDLYARVYTRLLPASVMNRIFRAYLPRFYRACDLVVAPSHGALQFVQQLGDGFSVEVVPNGVDLVPFAHVSNPVKRSDLGFNTEDVVLAFVGRLGEEKNITFLLDAFSAVAKAYDHVRLLLVGGGPLRGYLQARAEQHGIGSRIYFAGLVPYEQVPRYLAVADAFVTASVTEVHPLTVIEAMAAGLPVLGIQSPGVGDTVQDDMTGYLVPHNLEAFIEKLSKLIIDSDRRQEMGKQARQAAQVYAIERTARTMLERYQKLIDQKMHRVS